MAEWSCCMRGLVIIPEMTMVASLVHSVHASLHITQVFDTVVVQVMPILTESNVS